MKKRERKRLELSDDELLELFYHNMFWDEENGWVS